MRLIRRVLLAISNFIDYKLLKIERAFILHEVVNTEIRAKMLPYFLATDGFRLHLITQMGFTPLFRIKEYTDINAYFDEFLLVITYGDNELLILPNGTITE